ncbi:hypothetical protein BpHYR1_010051 [Brachionus plicatilis]|uniref:Uncharacterized protein n=1 Tax=Brachionus plicatilis TaxID=10195 RepID=A0A3M7R9V1_BRAPC|nr:hypothetical protein BpHYR1_010051 [Brachionus plicatilis]
MNTIIFDMFVQADEIISFNKIFKLIQTKEFIVGHKFSVSCFNIFVKIYIKISLDAQNFGSAQNKKYEHMILKLTIKIYISFFNFLSLMKYDIHKELFLMSRNFSKKNNDMFVSFIHIRYLIEEMRKQTYIMCLGEILYEFK